MTEMPIEHAAHAAATGAHAAPPQPSAPSGLTRWGRVHSDIAGFGHALLHMAPVLERIATSPLVDELVEAALQADGLGVEDQAFHAAIDALTGASKRKQQAQGAGPQRVQPLGPPADLSVPQFLPAPASGAM